MFNRNNKDNGLYNAFRTFTNRLDTMVEEMIYLGELDIEPKPEVSYFEGSNSIRIIDKNADLVVTAVFNVKEGKDSYVDKFYCRPYKNAPRNIGNGVLISVGINDSTCMNNVKSEAAKKFEDSLSYDRFRIMNDYAFRLGNLHSEECGIEPHYKDRWIKTVEYKPSQEYAH